MVANKKRSLKNGLQYNSLIAKADLKTHKLSNFINVDDTVVSMKNIVRTHHHQVAKLAQTLKRNTIHDTCKAIFDFVYGHIQYTKDRAGYEEIRTPARTWADRTHGVDCDCYSVFIGAILYNLGIPFSFRVTKYGRDWQHVYPIAYDRNALNHQEFQTDENGEEVLVRTNRPKNYIIIDCVVDDFDYEVPYTDNKDYKMSTIMLSGVDDQYDYDTTVAQDLGALGRAKKKKKAKNKAARKQKKTQKKAAKKQAKAKKKQAKATKKAQKKQKKTSSTSTKKSKKRGGFASKLKAKVKQGKEKRKAKRAVKKEKKKANPQKRGLFSKIKAKKKAKKQAKAAQRAREKVIKTNPTRVNPTKKPIPAVVRPMLVKPKEFETPQIVQQDEFAASTSTTDNKEFMSEDGNEYVNTGSWGGSVKNGSDQEINFDASELENQMNQDTDTSIQNSMKESAEQIDEFAKNLPALRENLLPDPVEPEDEELETSLVENENEPEEGEKTGVMKYVDKAITYAKENPVVTASVAVGVPLGVWGIGKLIGGSKSVNGVDGLDGIEGVDGLDGLDGTKKKGKKKNKSKKPKNKPKTSKSSTKTTSKAHRKYGRATFNGLK